MVFRISSVALGIVQSTVTLATGNMVRFGVLYSLGNFLSLMSTTLLFGPLKQVKNMFARKRAIATTVYLLALMGTIVVAVVTKNVPGTVCMIVVQFLALVWYTLSYIPYARDCVLKAMTSCCR
jgi:predicted membrane channel-forming protein YqfA (hemolysin III family)